MATSRAEYLNPQTSKDRVTREELKKYPRETSISVVGGTYSDDPESCDEGSKHLDGLASAALECYSQPETVFYAGSIDWEVIFSRAGVPLEYRPSWRRLLVPGAKVRDIPDAHYRWIRRACTEKPWRSRILQAIRDERKVNPLFGQPHIEWRNQDELHRTRYSEGWQPIAQASVSTLCRRASASTTLYWKEGEHPGPLTRKVTKRTIHRAIVACNGFRKNFQGAQLEEYGKSVREGIASLISGRWIPDLLS